MSGGARHVSSEAHQRVDGVAAIVSWLCVQEAEFSREDATEQPNGALFKVAEQAAQAVFGVVQ